MSLFFILHSIIYVGAPVNTPVNQEGVKGADKPIVLRLVDMQGNRGRIKVSGTHTSYNLCMQQYKESGKQGPAS